MMYHKYNISIKFYIYQQIILKNNYVMEQHTQDLKQIN
jgi:hypothetical protein